MSRSAGFSSAVAKGNTRAALVALRDLLARELEGCESGRDTAALSARLMDVLARLDALPVPVKGTVLDELAQRRSSGERVTARPARARRG